MFNKISVSEVAFHYCVLLYCDYFENRQDVSQCKVQIFYFLCCRGVVSRERGSEGLSSVAKELSVSLLTLYFYIVFK